MSINEFRLVGRIGKIYESRVFESRKGGSVARQRFSVATDRGEETDWHTLQYWGKDELSSALMSGDMVEVRGYIKQGNYEKDGKKIYTTDLVATCVLNLHGVHPGSRGLDGYFKDDQFDNKRRNPNGQNGSKNENYRDRGSSRNPSVGNDDPGSDTIPF